jgi:hypothetical protein
MINSLALCNETLTMLSASDDKSLRLWDLHHNSAIREMKRT